LWIAASRGLLPHLADRLVYLGADTLFALAPELLAGFTAELPTLELADGVARAHRAAEAADRDRWRGELGLTRGARRDASVHVRNEVLGAHAAVVLVPVYVAAYRVGGGVHQVIVDGQTGRTIGWAPFSTAKLVAWTIVVPALFFLVATGPGVIGYLAVAIY